MKYDNETLNERESSHGDYGVTASVAQDLKKILFSTEKKRHHLSAPVQESLELLCTKMARIISGNPENPDHWKDIAGYANLVSERLKE